jgi:cation diffusion facilitator CzcD-associated flavoprotein CzcO
MLFGFREGLTASIRHPRTLGRLSAMRSARFMRAQVPDSELRRRVWPDYTFGCKRALFSSYYLPTLSRSNVEPVTEPIAEVTAAGPRTGDGVTHPVDCIIWATGFQASEFVAPMDVRGTGGVRLAQAWDGGAHAHLGLTVPGFPSLFLMYGPNTNTRAGRSSSIWRRRRRTFARRWCTCGRPAVPHWTCGPLWKRPQIGRCRRASRERHGWTATPGITTARAGSSPTGPGTWAAT